MAQQHVFISYAWGGESETVANEVEAILQQQGISLVRDKTDLGFKGLIREFMHQIGQGNLVVLIISDKYLKSKNCMFELMEVERKGEFFDRIFPIVLPDGNIYDSLGILNYLKYWDQKIKELNASAKELDNLADTRKVQEDINLYTDIRGAIDELAGKLSNMNTLTLEIMRSKSYQPLIDALLSQSGKISPQPVSSATASRKEGKVLYHIPGMMQLNTWTRCTVRLAWEEIYLLEGLKIPEDQRVIESIRLGNVMQVSLNEGKDGHNFEIKPLNNEEQVIFEDDFTEWLFDVKALNTGNFTLILRVTLIQIIEGKERKKDVVLERNVVTEAVVPKALARFETAEDGLTPPRIPSTIFHTLGKETTPSPEWKPGEVYPEMTVEVEEVTDRTKISTASSPAPSPESPSTKPTLFKKFMPYAASLLVLLTAGILIFNGGITTSSPEYAEVSATDTVSYSIDLGEELVGSPPPQYAESSSNDTLNYSEEESLPTRMGSGNPNSRKVLLTFSEENTSGSVEVMAFVVTMRDLYTLEDLNSPMKIRAFAIPDSIASELEFDQEFSVEKILDSVSRFSTNQMGQESSSSPVVLERIPPRPQEMDSASLKTLRKITKRSQFHN